MKVIIYMRGEKLWFLGNTEETIVFKTLRFFLHIRVLGGVGVGLKERGS